MHIGHQATYLQIFIMPYLLRCLFQATYLTDPMLCKTTYNVFICKSPWRWPTRGRRTHSIPKRLCKKKKPSMCLQKEATIKAKNRTYLVSVAVSAFKVGCRVEGRLRELLASHHPRQLPSFPQLTFTALSSTVDRTRAVHFNSDSYPIGIDTHATCCMANAPHLFEDLKLGDVGEIEGIKSGLDIKGTGTFKFKINDDTGTMHEIKILNLYVPELNRCLLSPQHWVQEAKDNYPRPKSMRMSLDDEILLRALGASQVPKVDLIQPANQRSHPLHCPFVACLPCVCHHLQSHGSSILPTGKGPPISRARCTVNNPKLVPEEFVAEENVNYQKNMSASEGANADDRTVKMASLPSPQQEETLKVT